MAYFISCSGAKTCLTGAETLPSSLENIKSFSDLHEARLELISLLDLNLDWKNTLSAYKLIEGQDIVKIYIKVKGNFFYKFSPTKNLIDQHKDWPNSSLELRFNFRSNFKKPNNVDFGNIYCVLKDFQNRKNFHTDFI